MRHHLLVALVFFCINFSGSLQAVEPEIEQINDNEFAFSLDGSRISIDVVSSQLLEKKDILLDWILYSAETVQHYYGVFPVRTVRISLEVANGDRVRSGRAFGGAAPFLRIGVGSNVTAQILRQDWIMVHEMVHLALASVPRKHRWLSEGLATYVESIARAQRNHLTEEYVWRSFIESMPHGLPGHGDRGLDLTPTWGRTYWGGAIFCMLADIEIRNLTDNKKSLREALRGLLAVDLSFHADATVLEVFQAGDLAVGVDVLVPLYDKMKQAPYPVDLDMLWRELGVSIVDEQVIYDESAPMAHVRKYLLSS